MLRQGLLLISPRPILILANHCGGWRIRWEGGMSGINNQEWFLDSGYTSGEEKWHIEHKHLTVLLPETSLNLVKGFYFEDMVLQRPGE